MNNRTAVERIRSIVDETGVTQLLVNGIARSPKGLKTNVNGVRHLLIGLLLAIEESQTLTITGAYEALTERMDIRDQIRLGIKIGPGPRDFINRKTLYHAAKLLTDGLAYGKSVEFDLPEDERSRRHDVLLAACNALLDYTAEATEVDDTELSADATAMWGWAKGKYLPKPSKTEIDAQDDELMKAALQELANGTVNTADDLEGAELPEDQAMFTDLDPDSEWCGKTGKSGETQRFYGKYIHALVAVPSAKIKVDSNTRAPIVRRIEVTPAATADLVKVTLRMIDSLKTTVKSLLIDRHYSYKQFGFWQSALIKRGIRQVLDLRADDHTVLRYPEATYLDGSGHCPAMPKEYFTMPRPGVFATREDHLAFQVKNAVRESFAHVVLNQMDAEGRMKLRCPARDFKVACPLFPPSMLVAAELGLTIINTNLLNLEPGQEPPRCCTQDSFRVTLPEQVAKLNQVQYWGSSAWYRTYGRRSYVEGAFGNMKNHRTENLRRGAIQKNGLVWAQLVVTLIAVSYNVRMIRARHDRMTHDPIDHPLLSSNEETVTHLSLSADQEAMIYERLMGEFGASLEVRKLHPAMQKQLQRSHREQRVLEIASRSRGERA
ncbi:MAG TPA: hypothetical protein VMV53_11435 [Acidimicrobiales bacterium]|nr:hypothetical protein [Acidimicrobiales bacterium]